MKGTEKLDRTLKVLMTVGCFSMLTIQVMFSVKEFLAQQTIQTTSNTDISNIDLPWLVLCNAVGFNLSNIENLVKRGWPRPAKPGADLYE